MSDEVVVTCHDFWRIETPGRLETGWDAPYVEPTLGECFRRAGQLMEVAMNLVHSPVLGGSEERHEATVGT